jgi:anti-anti-sigma factor
MALQRGDTRRPGSPSVRAAVSVGSRSGPGARGDPAPKDQTTLCTCNASSFSLSAGVIVVLRVSGEIDLGNDRVLRDALDAVVEQRPGHLVVDLGALRFCSVRAMSMLVAAAAAAAAHGTRYGVSAVPERITRFWSILWPVGQLPIQFPTAAAAIFAALADQEGPPDGTPPRARRRTRRGLVSVKGGDTHGRSLSTDRPVSVQPVVIDPEVLITP